MSKKSWFPKRAPKGPAQTTQTLRTAAEIQAEFDKCAKDAGDLQFNIVGLQALLQRVNMRMGQLQDEYSLVKRTEAEKLPEVPTPAQNAPVTETQN
jgi:hypothetical protein